ncbi:UDP-galactose transporter senju isoform X2 [Procambarus clarkii]|uniref:UDP-galactose transporter senju isoform X2 n=1 Tax=Procambarus clarkii TaxID=6728 RepID=UPI0037432EB0
MTRQDGTWGKLFPTPWSFVIFVAYMVLFINQGIIVTASQRADSSYSYNTVTVVFLTEATKLLTSLIIFLKDNRLSTLIADMRTHLRVLGLYMVPALLYCLYNNLAFVNLAAFDPTTYFLLLQLRVVVTGISFQVVFKKQLSRRQWVSLLILTVGCIVKQLSSIKKQEISPTQPESTYTTFFLNFASLHTGLMLVQVFCSCLAGVYNEKLLKDTGVEVHIMVQNVFMYIDSIICNAVILLFRGELFSAFTAASLTQIIFGIPVDWWTAAAITLVIYATYMYAQSPVVNRGRLDELEKGMTSGEAEQEMLVINRSMTAV